MRHRRSAGRPRQAPPTTPATPPARPAASDPTGASPDRLDADGREHRRDGLVTAAKANPAATVRRRELALGLMAAGAPRSMVVGTLVAKEGLTRVQASTVYLAVCEEARAEYEDARPYLKALQVERLQRDLAAMRAAGRGRVSYRSVAQHEALLARILGTLEPVKTEVSVDATVRESLVAVVAGMDRDRMDALVAEQLALEDAARGRSLVAAGEEVRRESGGSGG